VVRHKPKGATRWIPYVGRLRRDRLNAIRRHGWAWPVAWNAIWVGALAARNSALGAITALLLGLIGSVIGGWLGSRKPMASYDDRAPSVTTGRPIV
jgi:hypothetical protein